LSERLYHFLAEHLNTRKRELFDQVAAERTRHLTVVLEDIYQTQNASAILRSAESWGVQDIHVIENGHSFNYHRRISKGAYDWLTFHRYNEGPDNTQSCISALRSKGYKIVSTTLSEGAVQPHDIPIDQPIALVMGTELSGITPLMSEHSDYHVMIPMCGFTESLNVSVAAGVLLHGIMQRLRASDIPWRLSEEEQTEIKIMWARKSISWSDYLVDLFESGETL